MAISCDKDVRKFIIIYQFSSTLLLESNPIIRYEPALVSGDWQVPLEGEFLLTESSTSGAANHNKNRCS